MVQKHFSTQSATTSTGDIASAAILKEVIFGRANDLLEFGSAVNTRFTDKIDYRFTKQEETEIAPHTIKEYSRAGYDKINFFPISGELEKKQIALMFTDETKIRELDGVQVTTSIQAAAMGMAHDKDINIKNALVAAAGNNVDAQATWDDKIASDASQDIAVAIGKIMETSNIPATMTNDIKLFYPAGLMGFLNKPVEVGDYKIPIGKWASDSFGIEFHPTRELTHNAIMSVKTDDSAFMLQHNGSGIKEYETERITGSGDVILFTQMYDTVVFPEVRGGSTNNYICTISDVK